MMRISFVILMFCLALGLRAQELPQPRPLSDTEQIRMIVQQIEQGVKQQDILQITDHFARTFQHGNQPMARFSLWDTLQSRFLQAEGRWQDSVFQAVTPASANLTSTWDYSLEIDTIRFVGNDQAVVHAGVHWEGSGQESLNHPFSGHARPEVILLQKFNDEWRVKNINKIFK